MLTAVADIMKTPNLRRRIGVVLALLAVYRIGFFIYLPGVNLEVLGRVIKQLESQSTGVLDFLRITSQLTGGNLSQATVFSLGIMPYISASIIFSLLVKVFPKMEEMQKDSEGRRQINAWTRYSTVVLCLIQSLFVIRFLHSPQIENTPISSGFWFAILQMICLTAGTMFLMWLGEKMTEKGIGNGTSLIIMAGIIASMPGGIFTLIGQSVNAFQNDPDEAPFSVLKIVLLLLLFVAIVVAVVYITRGQRRIPIQQQRSVRGRRVAQGQRQYMPIRVNSAGVLPIIFAQSLMLIPATAIGFIAGGQNWFTDLFQPSAISYMAIYVGMIFFFTFFWTSLMFNPVEISQNMKEQGAFIPGIRPGPRTAEYLEQIIRRITLAGAAFLAIIALVPQLLSDQLGVEYVISGFMGGTGILIVVGVALDLVDKIEAQVVVRQYEGFMQKPGGPGGPAPSGDGPSSPAPSGSGDSRGAT